jgi:hypothetical protein
MNTGPSGEDMLQIAAFGPSGPTGLIVDPMGVTGFMATGPTGPYFIPYTPPPPVSPYIITLADLMAIHDVISQREADDIAKLTSLSSPNEAQLKVALMQWACCGFPDIYPVFTLTMQVPGVCADGVSRSLFDYVPYLTSKTIAESMNVLQAKLSGIQLSYSLPSGGITYHATKA